MPVMKTKRTLSDIGPGTVPDPVDSFSIPSQGEHRYSQSLERGLTILKCFTQERPVLGIADIADDVGVSRATAHRYAITLVALGFLEQGLNRKYRLGLRVTDLGMARLNSIPLRKHSRPYLEELRQRCGYTISVSVLDGPEILYVDRARSYRQGQCKIDLDLRVRVGSRQPPYCTAMGKVLLASLEKGEQREIIALMELASRGPNTITNEESLLTELHHVGEEGMAVSNEELAAGLISIAAPVRGANRKTCAAIDIAAHVSMISLPELTDQFFPHLVAAADNISAHLGFRRGYEATL